MNARPSARVTHCAQCVLGMGLGSVGYTSSPVPHLQFCFRLGEEKRSLGGAGTHPILEAGSLSNLHFWKTIFEIKDLEITQPWVQILLLTLICDVTLDKLSHLSEPPFFLL